MPVIKSAIKKLRQDKKRTEQNMAARDSLKSAVKKATRNSTKKTLSEAFSAIDQAVKRNLIHKNKAARLKSSLVSTKETKVAATPVKATPKSAPKKVVKKTTKKTSKKASR